MSFLSTLGTLTSSYTVTTSLTDGDGYDSLATTYSSASTTTGSTCGASTLNHDIITINLAQNYVESMTDDQLAEFTTKLDNKEIEFDLNKEAPVVKVYKKS